MKILIYKRTHIGDPDLTGEFGINDCMGELRELDFEAVIGIGGVSSEPQRAGISRKINWVGIDPIKKKSHSNYRAPSLTFKHFLLLENKGPNLKEFAPRLAKRFFTKKSRFVFKSFRMEEMKEAKAIIEWSKKQNSISKIKYESMVRELNNSNRKRFSNCICST